jgi:hypothetical protein
MHESIDESQNFMIICFLRSEMRNFGEISMSCSPPYIFSRFFETINELWRLESVRRHEVNTLYVSKISQDFASPRVLK